MQRYVMIYDRPPAADGSPAVGTRGAQVLAEIEPLVDDTWSCTPGPDVGCRVVILSAIYEGVAEGVIRKVNR